MIPLQRVTLTRFRVAARTFGTIELCTVSKLTPTIPCVTSKREYPRSAKVKVKVISLLAIVLFLGQGEMHESFEQGLSLKNSLARLFGNRARCVLEQLSH